MAVTVAESVKRCWSDGGNLCSPAPACLRSDYHMILSTCWKLSSHSHWDLEVKTQNHLSYVHYIYFILMKICLWSCKFLFFFFPPDMFELFTCWYDRVEFTESIIDFFCYTLQTRQHNTMWYNSLPHTQPVQLVCLNDKPKNSNCWLQLQKCRAGCPNSTERGESVTKSISCSLQM